MIICTNKNLSYCFESKFASDPEECQRKYNLELASLNLKLLIIKKKLTANPKNTSFKKQIQLIETKISNKIKEKMPVIIYNDVESNEGQDDWEFNLESIPKTNSKKSKHNKNSKKKKA